MRTHYWVLVIAVSCVVVAGSPAVSDDQPPKTQGSETPTKTGEQHKQAGQSKDLQELEKRADETFLAECKENDRLYKQMVKAKPNDTQAWLLLSWNAAYNLSVTSQEVKERYAHVKRGIEYLVECVGHNPTNAVLYWHTGFYLHNRIGQGSERRAFRALFRNDKEFHKLLAGPVDLKAVAGPDGLPDNFLVAQRWCEKTIAIVEKHGLPADFTDLVHPLILNSYPAICQRAHASAIEDEGHFGEIAIAAWKQAQKMWEAVGEREVVAKDGKKLHLKDNEAARMVVNYDYWKQRCQVEQTEPVLTARQAVYRVRQHLAKHRADFTDEARAQAKQLFDQAFRAWAKLHKEHPWFVENETELEGLIYQYQYHVLKSKQLPDDFPLRNIPGLSPRAP